MNQSMNTRPHNQQGFATIYIVLMVGLAIAASALGTAYYIATSQKSLVVSLHLPMCNQGHGQV